jgi:hypothetical protein
MDIPEHCTQCERIITIDNEVACQYTLKPPPKREYFCPKKGSLEKFCLIMTDADWIEYIREYKLEYGKTIRRIK